MRLTNEQINVAHSELRGWCRASMSIPPKSDEQAILTLIDALCEAARQPENLVGRKVRLRTCHEITGTVRALASYSVEWDTGVTADASPSIFELLEDADAK